MFISSVTNNMFSSAVALSILCFHLRICRFHSSRRFINTLDFTHSYFICYVALSPRVKCQQKWNWCLTASEGKLISTCNLSIKSIVPGYRTPGRRRTSWGSGLRNPVCYVAATLWLQSTTEEEHWFRFVTEIFYQLRKCLLASPGNPKPCY
jgi:hypothetical protein